MYNTKNNFIAQRKCVVGAHLPEFSSILMQLHIYKGQIAWKHGGNRQWNAVSQWWWERWFPPIPLTKYIKFLYPNSVNASVFTLSWIIKENSRLYSMQISYWIQVNTGKYDHNSCKMIIWGYYMSKHFDKN